MTSPAYTIIRLQDPAYPSLLKEIASPPKKLYVHGDATLLNQTQLAIVGSRNPSHSGREHAKRFSREATQYGLVITSGLAMGIDACAHEAALEQGRTIAVLGCGIDQIYPKCHRTLYNSVAQSGCLVSEFPPGTPPRAHHFPMRNRIITGLSLGTLVVEAAIKSGSLISARTAMEQNREVFAVPGHIDNPLSRGPHQLIQQGAKLVETINDIIVELPNCVPSIATKATEKSKKHNKNNDKELDSAHCMLLEYMQYERMSLELLIHKSGLSAQQVKKALLELELFGHIKCEFGQYEKV